MSLTPTATAATAAHPYPIVGFSGFSGSGKDSAAVSLIKLGWTRCAFADRLRAFTYAVNPMVDRDGMRLKEAVDLYGWEGAKRKFLEVRELLQRTGTDAGRDVLGGDVWVDAVMLDLPDTPVAVTDVRFPNEARAIKAAGGVVIRVNRHGAEPINSHVSDTSLDGWEFDAVIDNDGSLGDLADRVAEVVSDLFGQHTPI